MAEKVAKIVTISLSTRVVVDVDATDEDIVADAESQFRSKIDNGEAFENLDNIRDDDEMPYSEDDE